MITKSMRRWLELGQLAGLACLLVGIYLLVGLAWTLLAGGTLLAAIAVVAELSRQRDGNEGTD